MSILIISLYVLVVIFLVVFFGAAIILWFFPKSKILSVKELEKTYQYTIPPKMALNKFGRHAYSVFHISGILWLIFLSLLVMVELTYGGTCIEEKMKECLLEMVFKK